MGTWIFVVNSDIYPAMRKEWEAAKTDTAWIVKQEAEALANAVGDEVYIYLAKTGIIAHATITGTPAPAYDIAGWPPERRAEVAKLDQVPITVDRWLDESKAISFATLRGSVLDGDSLFVRRSGNGTNFRLEPSEAAKLSALFKQR